MATEIKKIKENDRVKRAAAAGCLGTVKEIKKEIAGSSTDPTEKGLMVSVEWDNGTISYMAPEALEIVS